MAHLSSDAAIFSPSVARLAASTARDWSHVDAWLATKYNGRAPPRFERNPDTLKALLALANLNEASDENRDLVARAERAALQGIHTATTDRAIESQSLFEPDPYDDHANHDDVLPLPLFRKDLFLALEHHLPREGSAALDAMASAAVQLDIALPEPSQLSRAMLRLQAHQFDLEQAFARVEILQRHIEVEAAELETLLKEVRNGHEYRPPADLARQNLDMQRKVKAMEKKVPEMMERVTSLARAVGLPNPTIDQVRLEEDKYLKLLDIKRGVDQQLQEFEGLPPDIATARQQLEDLRMELRTISDRRDAVFEGLVERETPRKGR